MAADRRHGDARHAVELVIRSLLVLAVLLAGLGAALIVQRRTEHNADALRTELATRATIDIRATTEQIFAALSGGRALVEADGLVDERSFESFASGVRTHTPLAAIAYEPVVEHRDRAAFETMTGLPIHAGPTGPTVPAPERDEYYPVRFVSPLGPTTQPVLGLDIGSEPIRAAAARAARDTGTLQLTRPVRTQPGDQVAVFVIAPLYRQGSVPTTVAERRSDHVGFITTAFSGARYLTAALRSFPPGTSVEIRDGAERIAATTTPLTRAATNTTDIGGRTWTIAVDDHQEPDQIAAWTLAVGAVLLAFALAMSFLDAARSDLAIRRAARRSHGLAFLGESIAAVESGDAVARVIVERAGPVMGADRTALASIDPVTGAMVVRRGESGGAVTSPLAESHPLATAIRTGRPVLLNDRAALRQLDPGEDAGSDAGPARAVAALPMFSTANLVIGAVGFEWDRAMTFDEATTSTMLTIADIAEQTVERARATEFRIGSAVKMAELARELTAARTFDEVVVAVNDKVPPAVDGMTATLAFIDHDRKVARVALPKRERARIAAKAGLTLSDPPASADRYLELGFDVLGPLLTPLLRGDPLMLDRASIDRFPLLRDSLRERSLRTVAMLPMMGPGNELMGVLIVAWAPEMDFNVVHYAQLGTIRDLCEQTAERARLYSSEHQVVAQLQARTLAPFPEVDGFELAGRYQPASADVGMGGDWYDAFETGSAISIVIGDVTGHGIQAVADMTQLRTSISALLRAGIEVSKVFATATDMIANDPLDHMRMATVACLLIDPSRRRAQYASAGHPPMLVRGPDGRAAEIGSVTQPPIGVPGHSGQTIAVDLEPGSIVIAYTDGLIERRDEVIDHGIERLRQALESATGGVDEIADHLLARCIGSRPTDDDVALVVVRVE